MGRFEVTLYQPGVYNPLTGKAMTYLLYDVGSGDKDYLLNGMLKLEVNKAGTFEFDILPSHTYYSMLRRYIHYVCIKEYATGSAIDPSDYIPTDLPIDLDPGESYYPSIEYLGDTKIMFYGRILSMSMSFNGIKHVVCEGLMANLLDCPMYNSGAHYSSITADKIFTVNGTPRTMFQIGINAYRNLIRNDIYVGEIHSDAGTYTFEEIDVSGGTSVGDFISGELVDAHGGFLDMQYRQVSDGTIIGLLNWLADPSMDEYSELPIDQTIEFGENLLDLSGENTDDEIMTGIIPTWEDSNKIKKWITVTSTDVDDPTKTIFKPYIVGSSGGVGSAGIKIIDIPCTTTQEGATSYATTYVNKYCNYNLSTVDFDSYTVRALDFHYIHQESKHKIDLYNRVRILCEPHSIDKVLLCTSVEISIDSPENSSYTFSVYRPKASSNEKTLTRQLGGRSGGNASSSEVSNLSSRVSAQEAKSESYITTETDPTVPQWAKASTKPSYTAQEVGALSSSDVANNLTTTAEGKVLDARQGKALKDLIDTTNDLIDDAVKYSDVANNLTTTTEGKVLDARQGKALKDMVDDALTSSDVANNLTTTAEGKVLDARQGKALKDMVDTALTSSDVANNLTTTTEGKVLDARQGKALKDMLDDVFDAGRYGKVVNGIALEAWPDDGFIAGYIHISLEYLGMHIEQYYFEDFSLAPDEEVSLNVGELPVGENDFYRNFYPVGSNLHIDDDLIAIELIDAYVFTSKKIRANGEWYEVYLNAHNRSTATHVLNGYVTVLYYGYFRRQNA